MQASLFDKTFRDGEGNFIIVQPPNLPLLVGVGSTLLKEFVFTSGNVYTALDAISLGALFAWAWMELFDGVNYFRRSLGAIVLIGIVALRIQ
ncbi:hypothetical protein [Altericista sp. CCNU0014]|uniref:hypothetical protein n=1 Tax=Altericista sp. CCNU0014 TaxID=3082949 RepID=UPI00385125D2